MSLNLDPTIITETDLLTLHNKHTLAEQHAVPGILPEELSTYTIPASGIVYLREQPRQQQAAVPTGTTVVEVPGGPFVETLSSPAAGQFLVNYINGTLTFNVADVGKDVLVSYTALGSIVLAQHVNNISTPLVPFYNKLNVIVPDLPAVQNFTFPADVTVTGDLNVLGVVNKLAVEVLDFTDNILLLNSGIVDDGAPISYVGLEVARSVNTQGDLTHPQLLWAESSLLWQFNSTSAGPTGTRAPLFQVYDKGGVQVTKLTTAQETTLVGTLVAGDAGLQWFNTDTNQFMGFNGTAQVILG
jgi:hypothetical protein